MRLTRFPEALGAITALGVVLVFYPAFVPPEAEAPEEAEPTPAQEITCGAKCPDGTRVTTFSDKGLQVAVSQGHFIMTNSEGCEATCAPTMECIPPNVPSVTKARFTCTGIAGFADIERPADVDLSFGSLWDETQAVPK